MDDIVVCMRFKCRWAERSQFSISAGRPPALALMGKFVMTVSFKVDQSDFRISQLPTLRLTHTYIAFDPKRQYNPFQNQK